MRARGISIIKSDLSADLKTGRYSSTVQVRLLRLWEARNVRRGGEFMEVVMLLLDSQKLTTKQLTKLIPENPGGFKSLIKIPPAHAVELLYFSDSPSSSSQEAADGSDIVMQMLAIELHKRLESSVWNPRLFCPSRKQNSAEHDQYAGKYLKDSFT
ncbi:hypothetical protein F2Q70_00002887 [Brassica cretica]|uniref:Uncharacterized protein n=1 Tax=Brassica cretica TaxID=69181 RepID=A0A8S9IQD7_BRACR|nr:hypothetical protein F2Q70_00002887 [Brassica cretica]